MTDPQPCWMIPDEQARAELEEALANETAGLMGAGTSGPAFYPDANRSAQWFGDTYPGAPMSADKVLFHTTETGSWPGYAGGASAPNLTYHPIRHEWRQHFRLDRSARALRDPSSTLVRENRVAIQVEIICSCDRSFATRYGYPYVANLDDQALRDLSAFVAFMHREYGVPLVKAPTWLSYPASYGNSAARMSGTTFAGFAGVCGHQHASGNSHGDPGSIPIDTIMAYATGTSPTPPPEVDVPLTPTEIAAIANAVWNRQVTNPTTGKHRDADEYLAAAGNSAYAADAKAARALLELAEVRAQLAEIRTLIAVPEPPPLPPPPEPS